jgi:4-amino-4-deoxy-L-arabinose transferase-like glycosyltransferase
MVATQTRYRARGGSVALVMMAILCGLSFAGLTRSLWTPDEPREAEISRQMWLAPSVVPSLNGRAFIEKPPLYYWTVAGVYELAGRATPAAARSVSALAGALTLLLVFFWGRREYSARVGLIACAGLATSLQFIISTHWVLIDPLLMLFTTLAAWSAWELIRGESRARNVTLLYVSLALALWIKGLIGPVLLASGFAMFALFERRFTSWRRLYSTAGLAILIGSVVLLVLAIAHDSGWGAVREWFWVNHVERFVDPDRTGHEQPLPYYLWTLPTAVFPWLVPLLDALRPSGWRGPELALRAKRYWGALVVGMFLILSAAATKRSIYLLPMLPVLALLLAANMQTWWTKQNATAGPIKSPGWWLQVVLSTAFMMAPTIATLLYLDSRDEIAVGFLGAAAVIFVGLAVLSISGARRAAAAALFAASAASVVGLMFVVPRLAETEKNMMPFLGWVDSQLPTGAPVYATGVDETLEGIVPFVTSRPVIEVDSVALESAPPAYVLVQDGSGGSKAPDLGRRYELLGEASFGPERYMALWHLKNTDEAARGTSAPMYTDDAAGR